MVILVAAALIVLSTAVVVYPFLVHRRPPSSALSRDDRAAKDQELRSVVDVISTLHLEHQLGHIPEGPYREQLRTYRWRAASALRQQEEGRASEAEWELEQEVLLARLGAAAGDGPGTSCPSCGALFQDRAARCPQCGAAAASATTDWPGSGQN